MLYQSSSAAADLQRTVRALSEYKPTISDMMTVVTEYNRFWILLPRSHLRPIMVSREILGTSTRVALCEWYAISIMIPNVDFPPLQGIRRHDCQEVGITCRIRTLHVRPGFAASDADR